MPHVHSHNPHEFAETEHAGTPSRRERTLELVTIVLLSLATLLTAWSGYQAAKWSGDQAEKFAESSDLRIEAQRAAITAGQQRIDDLLQFDGWLDARSAGREELEELYRGRFREEFLPAFRAWLAQDPFKNPEDVLGPQELPEYRLAEGERAAELDRESVAAYKAGIEAKENDDDYILTTVFFAAVLFFAAISMRLDWFRLRVAVIGFAAAILAGGIAMLITLPMAP